MSSGTPTIAQLEAEAEELQFPSFSFGDAWAIGSALVERGMRESLAIAIDITVNGQVLFHAGLPGSSPDNDQWLARKARVVQRFHKSSLLVAQRLKEKGDSLEGKFGLPVADYAPYGGAVALRIRGAGVVGTVSVSGLADHEDHLLAVEAMRGRLAEREKPAQGGRRG